MNDIRVHFQFDTKKIEDLTESIDRLGVAIAKHAGRDPMTTDSYWRVVKRSLHQRTMNRLR